MHSIQLHPSAEILLSHILPWTCQLALMQVQLFPDVVTDTPAWRRSAQPREGCCAHQRVARDPLAGIEARQNQTPEVCNFLGEFGAALCVYDAIHVQSQA